jgi:hypothetical protein
MNSIMRDYYPIFEMYQALRSQLMDLLDDMDLAFSPAGDNPALGALCREIGEVQSAYIRSFSTFEMDLSFRYEDAAIEGSVSRLVDWFARLDAELKDVVAGLSDEDIAGRKIVRGPDFELLPLIQLDVYKEALLIFYAKVSVYLRLMGKKLPQQWVDWIG